MATTPPQHAIADAHAPSLARGFLEAVERWRADVDMAALERACAAGDVASAIAAVYPLGRFGRELVGTLAYPMRTVIQQVAAKEGMGLRSQLQKAALPDDLAPHPPLSVEPDPPDLTGFTLSLTLENPEATKAALEQIGSMIQGIDAQTLKAVRAVVGNAFKSGGHPHEQAKQIVQFIGLNQRQALALGNYFNAQNERLKKQEGKHDGGPDEGQPLSQKAQVLRDTRVLDYQQRLLQQRAVTIARTETIRASELGREALWQKAASSGLLDKDATSQKWVGTHDGHMDRSICAPMDGQVVALGEPFIAGFGYKIDHPPAHPRCRCTRVLVLEPAAVLETVSPAPWKWQTASKALQADWTMAAQASWELLDPKAFDTYVKGGEMADYLSTTYTKAWQLAQHGQWADLWKIDPALPKLIGQAPGLPPLPKAWPVQEVLLQLKAGLYSTKQAWTALHGLGLDEQAAVQTLTTHWGLASTAQTKQALIEQGILKKPSAVALQSVLSGAAEPKAYYDTLIAEGQTPQMAAGQLVHDVGPLYTKWGLTPTQKVLKLGQAGAPVDVLATIIHPSLADLEAAFFQGEITLPELNTISLGSLGTAPGDAESNAGKRLLELRQLVDEWKLGKQDFGYSHAALVHGGLTPAEAIDAMIDAGTKGGTIGPDPAAVKDFLDAKLLPKVVAAKPVITQAAVQPVLQAFAAEPTGTNFRQAYAQLVDMGLSHLQLKKLFEQNWPKGKPANWTKTWNATLKAQGYVSPEFAAVVTASKKSKASKLPWEATKPKAPKVEPQVTFHLPPNASQTPQIASHIPVSFEAFGGMTKIPGPHGAQEGQWYQDAGGHEFYVKPAADLAHAANEVGAMLVYQQAGAVAGLETPHVAVLKDMSGKPYIVSEKVSGLGSKDASWWKTATAAPYRADAEKLWAVDALLSHYDVVGANPAAGFDNLLVQPETQAVFRVEAGGAMRYSGLGASKPSWDPDAGWVEPWTMRGIAHDGQPGGPTVKPVFGGITNQRAAELLGALKAQVDVEALAKAWADLGMPVIQIGHNLEVIKHRLDLVPAVQEELGYPGAKSPAVPVVEPVAVSHPETARAKLPVEAPPSGAPIAERPAWIKGELATVAEVVKAIGAGDANPVRGFSVPFDGGDIEDLDARVLRLTDYLGRPGYEVKFKLSAPALRRALTTARSSWAQTPLALPLHTATADGYQIREGNALSGLAEGGTTYTKRTSWGEIRIHELPSSGRAAMGTVQVMVMGELTDDHLARAAREMGVKSAAPKPADLRALAEARLLYVFEPAASTIAERQAALARIERDWGVTAADLEITHGAGGRIEMRLPQAVADRIASKFGVEAFRHDINGGTLGQIILDPQKALLSTLSRFTEGISTQGISSSADVSSGGASYVFTRQTTYAAVQNSGGYNTLVIDGRRALRRLDWFAYAADTYGRAHGSVYSGRTMNALAAQQGSQEAMFKGRVGLEDVEYVLTKDPAALIQQLRASGMSTWVDGRQLAEVVVAPGHPLTPRGAPKTPTPGVLEPFVVSADETKAGPAQTSVYVPKTQQPIAQPGWTGKWIKATQVDAEGNPRWVWQPPIVNPGTLTLTNSAKVAVAENTGASAYKFYVYTPSKQLQPPPIYSEWGSWQYIKESPSGLGSKWGWFEKTP